MLAHSRAQPRSEMAPPADEGPSVDDLTLPEPAVRGAGVLELIKFVQRVHEFRISVFGHFDDAYERLVTVGDADGYPACVERFRPKFAALDGDLERVAMRLDALQQPPLGALARSILRSERKRFDAKLEEQVLRQRLSITDLEDDERPALKQQVQQKGAALAAQAAAVEEALEELRAEAADAEDEED